MNTTPAIVFLLESWPCPSHSHVCSHALHLPNQEIITYSLQGTNHLYFCIQVACTINRVHHNQLVNLCQSYSVEVVVYVIQWTSASVTHISWGQYSTRHSYTILYLIEGGWWVEQECNECNKWGRSMLNEEMNKGGVWWRSAMSEEEVWCWGVRVLTVRILGCEGFCVLESLRMWESSDVRVLIC